RKKNTSYITRYFYDGLGNRVKAEINKSVFVENIFDNLSRRIKSEYRDAGVYTFLYDAMGNVVERKDGKGDIVHNSYDEMSRIIEVRYGGRNGNLVEQYEYDNGDPGEFNTKGKLMKV